MKNISLRTAGVALAIALASASGTASAWGGHYHHGGYYHGGYHGPNGWVVGGVLGLAAAGTYLALTSRPSYEYPAPVYYSPPPVYVAPQPVYAAPPVQYVAPAPQRVASADVIAYPTRGQSPSQQTRDRGECERWATNQSGFDPNQASQWTTGAQTDTYTRSIGACMKGRGYSIN